MSEYRVISEPYRADRFTRAAATHRRLRGDDSVGRLVTTVEAPDVLVALHRAIETLDHQGRSITSIEETVPVEALYFSDEEITAALLRPEDTDSSVLDDPNLLSASDFPDDEAVYETDRFNDTVKTVAILLGRSLVPGLHLTVITDDDGHEYAIIEVRDAATRNYLAVTEDMPDLTEIRTATGWNGVLAVAKAVISAAGPLV